MKFVNNIKKLLFDDEDEIVHEEVKETPIREVEEKEEPVSEKDLYKSPSTFKFPVIFEEEDLKPKEVVDTKKYVFDKNKNKDKKPVEEKRFTPSPIISPIYGILDKNYKKDEIQVRTESYDNEIKRSYKKVDIDSVRQKAFGTLEDDLEQTILEDRGFIYGIKDEEDHEDALTNELGSKEEVKPVEISIEEAYENYSDFGHEYKKRTTRYIEEQEERLQKTEVLEEELFSLINSMYKDEDSEE